ncbi:hypothetical protein HanRHA438_Chr09g0383901 [Helianthus annuus]|nr:hypothetical protein HanRHA438_Chr09g0383901 [Helianthus annuus]
MDPVCFLRQPESSITIRLFEGIYVTNKHSYLEQHLDLKWIIQHNIIIQSHKIKQVPISITTHSN